MDLFHLQEEAPGMVFWHPNGWSYISGIEKIYWRKGKRIWLSGSLYTFID